MSRITKDGIVYVKAKEFCELSEVNKRTLRHYAQKGIVQTVRDNRNYKNHYYYRLDEAEKLRSTNKDSENAKISNQINLLVEKEKNKRKYMHVCYSLGKDETEEYKIKHEEDLFGKHVSRYLKNVVFYHEYGDSDDLKRPVFKKLIEKCCRNEIVYFFITSNDSLAKDLFRLIYALLISCCVTPLIVNEKGEWIRFTDEGDERSFYINQEQFMINDQISRQKIKND